MDLQIILESAREIALEAGKMVRSKLDTGHEIKAKGKFDFVTDVDKASEKLISSYVKKKFPAMYNAFCYGAPPHAGIAPGIDRMVMLLAGEDSIREIIPFPMNKNAQDIMMGAPGFVEQKQLDELHLAIRLPEDH